MMYQGIWTTEAKINALTKHKTEFTKNLDGPCACDCLFSQRHSWASQHRASPFSSTLKLKCVFKKEHGKYDTSDN